MSFKAEIPYGAYWSTPFVRWQGSFAHLHSYLFLMVGSVAAPVTHGYKVETFVFLYHQCICKWWKVFFYQHL